MLADVAGVTVNGSVSLVPPAVATLTPYTPEAPAGILKGTVSVPELATLTVPVVMTSLVPETVTVVAPATNCDPVSVIVGLVEGWPEAGLRLVSAGGP